MEGGDMKAIFFFDIHRKFNLLLKTNRNPIVSNTFNR